MADKDKGKKPPDPVRELTRLMVARSDATRVADDPYKQAVDVALARSSNPDLTPRMQATLRMMLAVLGPEMVPRVQITPQELRDPNEYLNGPNGRVNRTPTLWQKMFGGGEPIVEVERQFDGTLGNFQDFVLAHELGHEAAFQHRNNPGSQEYSDAFADLILKKVNKGKPVDISDGVNQWRREYERTASNQFSIAPTRIPGTRGGDIMDIFKALTTIQALQNRNRSRYPGAKPPDAFDYPPSFTAMQLKEGAIDSARVQPDGTYKWKNGQVVSIERPPLYRDEVLLQR